MKNRNAINVLASTAIVATWGWLYVFLHPRPPAIDRRPHEAMGEVLAAEAAKVLEPGARLLVIARDPEPFHVPASAAQMDGFMRALKNAGKSVSTIHKYQQDPLRLVNVPPGDFFELLRRGQPNDVIVSFLGPPVLDHAQLAKLGDKRPRILAVCAGAMPAQVDLKKIFDQKLLFAAVVSRQDAPRRASAGSKQSAFEQMFKVITAANLSELAPSAVAAN
jgi:hypothetical protein